ncbi:hypothetical protein Sjap_005322 [Stephania japonica]|uniref:Uncharacterized protein n=1 Tax=Stephania japonica TaxID=461633 RepID=A0AAP0PJY7_9MAGN
MRPCHVTVDSLVTYWKLSPAASRHVSDLVFVRISMHAHDRAESSRGKGPCLGDFL